MHILLVDDHPLFREALRSMVRLGLPQARIEEAESITSARAVIGDRPTIDLIMLDLSMKGVTGFDGLMTLRIAYPRIPILVVSAHEEPRIVREALQLGASGYVPKSSGKSVYMEAIREIGSGGVFVPDILSPSAERRVESRQPASSATDRIATLTPAQMNVLTLIKRGKINKQIAYELGIGDSMVKAHVSEIMRKLGVSNRTQVAICASSLDFDRVGL